VRVSKNIIELKNISMNFLHNDQNIQVFQDFSLNIKQGDLNIILGPTGCGKSTLLNLIAGTLLPAKGAIHFTDKNIQAETRSVFQHYTLFPWLKIISNIEFGLKMQRIGKVKRRKMAEEIIHTVGLSRFMDHFPHQLSGGMRQRAAIAQALVTEPALLLMDEPFGALDDFTRSELQELLLDIHDKKHITTIFVTHSIDEALKLGDRVLLFSKRPTAIIEDIRVGEKTDRHYIDDLYVQLRQQLHLQFER
jgi:NitT/TauT family transport system ATP-binding protein